MNELRLAPPFIIVFLGSAQCVTTSANNKTNHCVSWLSLRTFCGDSSIAVNINDWLTEHFQTKSLGLEHWYLSSCQLFYGFVKNLLQLFVECASFGVKETFSIKLMMKDEGFGCLHDDVWMIWNSEITLF